MMNMLPVFRILVALMLAFGPLVCGAAGSTYFVSDLHLGVGRDSAEKLASRSRIFAGTTLSRHFSITSRRLLMTTPSS